MKKSELTQLTQIIEHLVRKEVRKQLPGIIAETFQNMMGKNQQPIVESVQQRKDYVGQEVQQPPENPDDFKMSMRELFAGATPASVRAEAEGQPAPRQPRHFTNNPVLNQILNETTGDLRQRERMVGNAAFMGGYSPSVAMAAAAMPGTMGVGEMMSEAELPSFARNMPTMPGVNPGVPLAQPPARMMNENAAPAAAIPDGVSALDVARQVPLAPQVTQALTKNYSAMMKLIDSKRKGKVAP